MSNGPLVKSAIGRDLTSKQIFFFFFCSTFLTISHIYVIYLLIFMVLSKNSDREKRKEKRKKKGSITKTLVASAIQRKWLEKSPGAVRQRNKLIGLGVKGLSLRNEEGAEPCHTARKAVHPLFLG